MSGSSSSSCSVPDRRKISLSQTAPAQPPYLPVLDLSAGWDGIKTFVACSISATS
jgi:hypothetical protein